MDGCGAMVGNRTNVEYFQFFQMRGTAGDPGHQRVGVQNAVIHAAQRDELGGPYDAGDIDHLVGKFVPGEMGLFAYQDDQVSIDGWLFTGEKAAFRKLNRMHQAVVDGDDGPILIETKKQIPFQGAETMTACLVCQVSRRGLGNVQRIAPATKTDDKNGLS